VTFAWVGDALEWLGGGLLRSATSF
jgi:hypothetical protein